MWRNAGNEDLQSKLTKAFVAALTFFGILAAAKFAGLLSPAPTRLPDDQAGSSRCMLWFVGSSSVHRWSTLQRDMTPWATHNRGIEGATLAEIVPLFAKVPPTEGKPAAIILYAGENDISYGQSYRQVVRDLARFAIVKGRLYPGVPLLIMSMKPSPGRAANFVEQQLYNRAAQKLVPHLPDATYVDITTPLLRNHMPRAHYQSDGIHMTAGGYAIWAKVVGASLKTAMPPPVLKECAPGR